MKDLDQYPLDFVMFLHMQKQQAEKNNDLTILSMLEKNYPGLFSEDFAEFIHNLKIVIDDLKYQKGIDFKDILEASPNQH